MKIVFIKDRDPSNKFDNTKITIEVEEVDISKIVDSFGEFLLACSFPDSLVNKYVRMYDKEFSDNSID